MWKLCALEIALLSTVFCFAIGRICEEYFISVLQLENPHRFNCYTFVYCSRWRDKKNTHKRIRLKRNREWRCFGVCKCLVRSINSWIGVFPFIKHKTQLFQIAIGECQRLENLWQSPMQHKTFECRTKQLNIYPNICLLGDI